MIYTGGGTLVCCGQEMELLVANTVDASKEKHVPVVTKEGGKVTVKVGSVEHPMVEEHYIQWIYLCTKNGGQRKSLKPGEKPEATFYVGEDEDVCEVYEYCNLHGLWVTTTCK
jgi:superoxide reductase